MSDLFEAVYGSNAPFHKVCRVAYTLGNAQPVVCTHIGDQPLFYLENEEDLIEEDEDDFFGPGNALIEREMQKLQAQIAGLERDMGYEVDLAVRCAEFAENFASITAPQFSNPAERLAAMQEMIERSRMGAALLARAQEHKIAFVLSAQVEKAQYDKRSGLILIQQDLSFTEQVLMAVRELRRHWQHREGALINPLTFLPEHGILVHRAQNADLMVAVVRVAWELQLAGERAFWERIEDSPMADLGRAYAREAFTDFRTINNGMASAAVMEAWFLSERCRAYDKKIIQAMLADYRGYVFENTEMSRSVTAELIAALGSVPFGKNYLAQHANTIMTDPIFTDVRDRSNANFLWFIKFERSFKETEQELQKGGDLSTRDIRHEVFTTKAQSLVHDPKHTAEIIPLFPAGPDAPAAGTAGRTALSKPKQPPKKRGGGAKIIDLRAWSSSR